MEFHHTLVGAQEAHQLAAFATTDSDLRFSVIDAINTAIVADAFTATVSWGSATESVQLHLLDELKQLGYTIDGTTTPGSWIITW